jgi:hypothetical protein
MMLSGIRYPASGIETEASHYDLYHRFPFRDELLFYP